MSTGPVDTGATPPVDAPTPPDSSPPVAAVAAGDGSSPPSPGPDSTGGTPPSPDPGSPGGAAPSGGGPQLDVQLPAISPLPKLRARAARDAAAASGEVRGWWPLTAVARGLALFFGAFTLLNVAGTLRVPAFDANVWWIDPPVVPRAAAIAVFAAAGGVLIAFGVAPRMRTWRRWTTFVFTIALGAAAVYDVVQFYRVWRDGLIAPELPLPLSLVFAALIALVAVAVFLAPTRPRRRWPAWTLVGLTVAACIVLFPLAQVLFFGTTDYRRPADVAVVFGAQVHRNGAPSTSLTDRVDTAVALYKDGLVGRLFMSGGVGDSGYNEALVMRDMAVARGVPAGRIVIDSNGVSTNATVADTVPFFGGKGWRRILAVSQFYHLPRIKLAYQRAGWDVLTVPARGSRPIKETPYLVAREIPAFWVYYLRAVAG
jgi:vancomycin permeability regulator SanA